MLQLQWQTLQFYRTDIKKLVSVFHCSHYCRFRDLRASKKVDQRPGGLLLFCMSRLNWSDGLSWESLDPQVFLHFDNDMVCF